MTFHDLIVIIAALINLTAFGGCTYWVVRWLRSLKGTVDAQAETISTLRTVLDVTDIPKMLERIEAYKKFVDQEKEAALTQAKRELTEEKNKSAESSLRELIHINEQLNNLVGLLARFIPLVPPRDREQLLGSANLSPQLKDRLIRLAEQAPDFSEKLETLREKMIAAATLIATIRPLMSYRDILAAIEGEEKK